MELRKKDFRESEALSFVIVGLDPSIHSVTSAEGCCGAESAPSRRSKVMEWILGHDPEKWEPVFG